jgi:hypothetical protein
MKAVKWILIIIVVLLAAAYGGFRYMKQETKKASPEATVKYERSGLELTVNYCRPYKKGRDIFGGLIPFEEVWRTGANEPTTFTTNQTLSFGDEFLEAGTYSLWTIPYKTQWTIILNSEVPGWGVGFDGEPSRDPDYDVLKINVPTQELDEVVEQFTIEFVYHVNLSMSWDQTKVTIPILYGYDN